MGLHLSCGIDFGYYQFHAFRKWVARIVNIELEDQQGFSSFKRVGGILCKVEGVKEWDLTDPLTIFLTHSDCDGHLNLRQLKKLLPRLKEIKVLSENKIAEGNAELEVFLEYQEYNRGLLDMLIEGFENSLNKKEWIRFY
jgi:hypothetical protein